MGKIEYLCVIINKNLKGKIWQFCRGWPKFAQLVAFNSCIMAAVLAFVFMGDLFRQREERLIEQKEDLLKKATLLTVQAGELTKTKNWLHEALVKSDKGCLDLQMVKEKLEKANFDLREKIEELEKITHLTTGRELKMVELKKELTDLKDLLAKKELLGKK